MAAVSSFDLAEILAGGVAGNIIRPDEILKAE
jgi:hypothetical protein